MIDRKSLLNDLRRELGRLEADLAEQAEHREDLRLSLKTEYQAAREAERIGESFNTWRSGVLTQAAVAWLLACVFVRFAEDNGLVDEALIAGPGERNTRAADRQTLYFRAHPTDSDRDYLLDVFATVSDLPGMTRLYDREHNPVWRYPISGDAARDLLAFLRAVDPDSGVLRHNFTDPDWDTRFLGDLYQDLSVEAKKRYALLQTPEFVEEFILDRTLTPALDEFGLAGTRLIDPACGSGHFLLGAFERLLRAWFEREPGTPERALVQRALDGVYGVDINPFAAAIAQFRLLAAALRASRVERLEEAPSFRIHVAAGDSLLHGRRFNELDVGSGAQQLKEREEFAHAFQSEDPDELNRILGQQYHVVVGNPPYIRVKDAAVNRLYRARYSTCHMKYAMSVPFVERFFGLAREASDTRAPGFVGVIVADSFMKREFGKKLIEQFLNKVDITHIIDTSGAYIPGHGTPTAILFARNRSPISQEVRSVLGIRGEPTTPNDPVEGRVWCAILSQTDSPGSESAWVVSRDVSRDEFSTHPWVLSGGGAIELLQTMEKEAATRIADEVTVVGVFGMTNADAVILASPTNWRKRGVERDFLRPVCVGENVRNWHLTTETLAIFPYTLERRLISEEHAPNLFRWLWRYRTTLGNRATFSKSTYFGEGRPWYEWHQVALDRLKPNLTITFAEVATHNHFALDRGGKIFNQTAPIIKLPNSAPESRHLGLLGLLNSSAGCFWMKQVFHLKGGDKVGQYGARIRKSLWEERLQTSSTRLMKFPIPEERPHRTSTALDHLATKQQAHLPISLSEQFPMASRELDSHRNTRAELLARMIALQEELDWECYRLYGITDQDYRYMDETGTPREPPPIALGERAFEIVMARRTVTGQIATNWFDRHGSVPITELPSHWPAEYRCVVERRIELIEADRFLTLIERPEYKRRWNFESWHEQQKRALGNWLLNYLESPAHWSEKRLATVRSLAERAATDADFLQVAEHYAGHAGVDIETLVAELVKSESVPALPVQRYKASGLAKREDWEETWSLQRREDKVDAEVAASNPKRDDETADEHAIRILAEQRRRKHEELDELTPPPKYRSEDFLKSTYWRLRGPLDVPKERFISLPQMSRDSDTTLLVGWAGWTELDLCQAVATYCTEVTEQDGWTAARLTPLLAIIQENLPWLKQWHNDVDPAYNQRLGDFFETYFNSQLSVQGLTPGDLRTWLPPKKA